MISAGFDGHGLDNINHGFMDIDEDDFYWVTENLIKIANTTCEGRVVSVLEGGYRIKGGIISALAQSVAFHVFALMNATSEHFTPHDSSHINRDLSKMELKRSISHKKHQMNLRKKRKINPELLEMVMESDESDEEEPLQEAPEEPFQEVQEETPQEAPEEPFQEVQEETLQESNQQDKGNLGLGEQ